MPLATLFYTDNEMGNGFLAIADYITRVAISTTQAVAVALGIVRYRCTNTITITLPDPVAMTAAERCDYHPDVANLGTGVVSIDVTNGRTINGQAIVTIGSQCARMRLSVASDNTNYQILTDSTP